MAHAVHRGVPVVGLVEARLRAEREHGAHGVRGGGHVVVIAAQEPEEPEVAGDLAARRTNLIDAIW